MLSRVIAKIVGDVFLRHSVEPYWYWLLVTNLFILKCSITWSRITDSKILHDTC